MKKLRNLLIVFLLILGSIFVTLGLLYGYYSGSVSNNTENKEVLIENGSSSIKIGQILKENNLIKNELFFKIYLKIHNVNVLKAGTYLLNENMNLKEIVNNLQEGSSYNPDEISITFKEGINMREIAKIIENNTNNTADDVMTLIKDKEYLQELIDEYWFITDDILNKKIYYSLEGYLYPETYFFNNKDVTVKEIFNKLISQMDSVLKPYKEEIEKSKFSVHELLTLASIAELEVNPKDKTPDVRNKVVKVFMNRLVKKMSLGSDITTRYSVKLDDTRPLYKSEYNSVNAYNTRSSTMAGKLPAGPIGMISKESIEASINPDDTKALYFISNIKTNETFFFEKYSDFEKKKAELAKVNNGY